MSFLDRIRQQTEEVKSKKNILHFFGETEEVKKAKILPEGTIREYGGQKVQKVGKEWVPVKSDKKKKKEEEPQAKEKKVDDSKKKESDAQISQKLKKYASETPTDKLRKFISTTKDEVAKKHAQEELDRRREVHQQELDKLSQWSPPAKDKFDSFFDDHDDQIKSFEPSEVKALVKYRTDAYKNVNNQLRSGDGKKSSLVSQIDSAFNKSALKSDVQLYRGVGVNSFFKDLKEGSVFTDKGFVSTSLKENVASDKFSHRVVMVVKAKQGQKAIPMENLGGDEIQKESKGEHEVLLPRDSRFKVVKTEEKGSKFYIHCEMV